MSRKQALPAMLPPNTQLIQSLVSTAPDAATLYARAMQHGINPADLVQALDKASFDTLLPQVVDTKLLGMIPAKTVIGADHVSSGTLNRAASELKQLMARKARNNRLAAGAGLAALLGLGAYTAFSNKPEDKYQQEVEKIMKSLELMK